MTNKSTQPTLSDTFPRIPKRRLFFKDYAKEFGIGVESNKTGAVYLIYSFAWRERVKGLDELKPKGWSLADDGEFGGWVYSTTDQGADVKVCNSVNVRLTYRRLVLHSRDISDRRVGILGVIVFYFLFSEITLGGGV